MRRRLRLREIVAASIPVNICCVALSQNVPITTLFNTGVETNDSNGNPQTLVTDGDDDPHYEIISDPSGNPESPAMVTTTGQYPFGVAWEANDSNSQWISPHADEITIEPPGTYIYETTFNLSGLNPSTAQISGSFWVDNEISQVILNSTNADISGGTFSSSTPFSITSGFVSGINTLDFYVLNGPTGGDQNPSGFRLEVSGTAEANPPQALTWNDASANNTWNTESSANWNNGVATTVFNAQDNVTFNDSNGSAAGRYAVTLNTTVSPGSVAVNNTTGNYTISGAGAIAGTASFTKSGTGTLTISTTGAYTGGTNVTGGFSRRCRCRGDSQRQRGFNLRRNNEAGRQHHSRHAVRRQQCESLLAADLRQRYAGHRQQPGHHRLRHRTRSDRLDQAVDR